MDHKWKLIGFWASVTSMHFKYMTFVWLFRKRYLWIDKEGSEVMEPSCFLFGKLSLPLYLFGGYQGVIKREKIVFQYPLEGRHFWRGRMGTGGQKRPWNCLPPLIIKEKSVTLNQRVKGSSPLSPSNLFNNLREICHFSIGRFVISDHKTGLSESRDPLIIGQIIIGS